MCVYTSDIAAQGDSKKVLLFIFYKTMSTEIGASGPSKPHFQLS